MQLFPMSEIDSVFSLMNNILQFEKHSWVFVSVKKYFNRLVKQCQWINRRRPRKETWLCCKVSKYVTLSFVLTVIIHAKLVVDLATRRRLAIALNITHTWIPKPQEEWIYEGTYKARVNFLSQILVGSCFLTVYSLL